MSTIKLPLYDHTLYLLIGPTGSGKSTFCQVASKAVADIGLSWKILSSDQFRQELTGLPAATEKYSPMFRAASKQAFALLEGGRLWKIRMPLPSAGADALMPESIGQIADYMQRNYRTSDAWWSGSALPGDYDAATF
jgi:energy-coupling factor transporter ATP-binding protein EcfA2